jgi:hypothetical protein
LICDMSGDFWPGITVTTVDLRTRRREATGYPLGGLRSQGLRPVPKSSGCVTLGPPHLTRKNNFTTITEVDHWCGLGCEYR